MDEKNNAALKDDALEQVSGGHEEVESTTLPSPWIPESLLQNYLDNNPCPVASTKRHLFIPVDFYAVVDVHGHTKEILNKYRCQICNEVLYILG